MCELIRDTESENSSAADSVKDLDEAMVNLGASWFTIAWTLHHTMPDNNYVASSMHELSLLAIAASSGQPEAQTDVMEVYGGEGRPTDISIHRKHRAGRDWDLVVGTDISDPAEQAALWRYIRECKPRLLVMAPL